MIAIPSGLLVEGPSAAVIQFGAVILGFCGLLALFFGCVGMFACGAGSDEAIQSRDPTTAIPAAGGLGLGLLLAAFLFVALAA